jgi:putative ABC transport system permease protein
MGSILKDLRQGARMLFRTPGFLVAAVVALSLGIAANTVIFSLVNAVLLRPLPFRQPDRLVTLSGEDQKFRQVTLTPADFVFWRNQTRIFEDLVCYTGGSFNLSGGQKPARVEGISVSAGFFSLLGVQPILGRAFAENENSPGQGQVTIIGNHLWRHLFNSDPGVIGKTLKLDGQNYTVVGVMGSDFQFLMTADLITPAEINPTSRSNAFFRIIGRLSPGFTIEQARAERDSVAAQLSSIDPRPRVTHRLGIDFLPLHELVAEKSRLVLSLLFGAVGFVLLIACGNLANLLLARATSRRKEMAIRAAIGASRWRLVRQLLTESLFLGVISGAVGLLLASWGIELLLALAPSTLPRVNTIGIDPAVLGFTLLLSLATSILFGLAPALRVSRLDLTEALKEGAPATRSRIRGLSLRNLLVIGQVSLALVLMTGAGLMLNSLVRLLSVDKGFDPSRLLTFNVVLPKVYPDKDAMIRLYAEASSRLRAIPGVRSVSTVNQVPLGKMGLQGDFRIEGMDLSNQNPWSRKVMSGSGYFNTLGIPLLAGREFDDSDNGNARSVAVVNEAFVRRYFGDEDPLGRRLSIDSDTNRNPIWREIVGVARDFKQESLSSSFEPAIFVPYAQTSKVFWLDFATFVVRTQGEPAGMSAAVQTEIQAIDPDLPAFAVQPMSEVISDSVSDPRFNLMVFGVFAGLALVLATVGIYGVISYSVTQRTREIGIRMAIGASPAGVVRMVVKQGAALGLIGICIGLGGAFALTRLISTLLFGIEATDPLTFGCVAALLMTVALLASMLPARRASKVDPMVALRYE